MAAMALLTFFVVPVRAPACDESAWALPGS